MVVLSTNLAYGIAPAAGIVLALGWFLYVAARYDNHTGSCFMLAVLVVLVIAVLTALVGFLALPGRY